MPIRNYDRVLIFKCSRRGSVYPSTGKLYDLLNGRCKLFARADAKENVIVQGLQELYVADAQKLMVLLFMTISRHMLNWQRGFISL